MKNNTLAAKIFCSLFTMFATTSVLGLTASFAAEEPNSVALESLGSMNKYSSVGYSACWGYTAPDGREYALLGVTNGLSIVDITNSPLLTEVAFIPNLKSSWTEMKTYSHYAYVVKDGARGGIQIIDLADLPRSATLVNTIMDYPTNHTVWVDEARGWLFTMGGDNTGVTVWNLLPDPTHPRQIVNFNSTYVHDLYVRGNRAYLAEIMSKSFSIYDISDIAHPKLIKRMRDPAAPGISFHNAWTTEDGRYLLTTEETRGRHVRIWDLSDETNPVEVSRWIGPGEIPHNVHVKGSFAHVAHYGGGYRVVDISNITQPIEVAHFNNKTNNPTGFLGVWEVYPYFASGKVVMSSIEDGLFVTRFDR